MGNLVCLHSPIYKLIIKDNFVIIIAPYLRHTNDEELI